MNRSTTLETTDIPDVIPQGQTISGFSYGLGLSLGLLFFILLLTYAAYLYKRKRCPTTTTTDDDSSTAATEPQGLDEAALFSYPKLPYSEAKIQNRQDSSATTAAAATGCSICLADYKDTDVVRQLPKCGHLFHVRCIDPWLSHNPTCPICRNSPAPVTTA